MMTATFTPTRGGDGGVYRAPPEPRHWRDNGRVVLTGDGIHGADRAGFLDACVATIDPADRAHTLRERLSADHGPMTPDNSVLVGPDLLECPKALAARFGDGPWWGPRQYHRSQVTSRGMPFDSMYNAAALTAARLQGQLGIDLGWRTGFPRAVNTAVCARDSDERAVFPRTPGTPVAARDTDQRAMLFAGMTSRAVRDMVRRPMRQDCTEEEKRLSAEGDRILAAGKAGPQRAQRAQRGTEGGGTG